MNQNHYTTKTNLIFTVNNPVIIRIFLAAAMILFTLSPMAQVSFTGSYIQNFNGMGTSSTIPAGWSHIGRLGGSATSWTSIIPSSGNPSAASVGTVNNSLIVATNNFTGTSNMRAFNYSDFSSSNRALGTSPTSGAGNILQLILSNNTGSALNSVQLSYNVRRFAAATNAETIPGYRLFVSVNGGSTWTAITAFDATTANFPNTVGTSTYNLSIELPATVQVNGQIRFRWVNDNSASSSVDQCIALDDVSVTLPNGACAIPGSALASNVTTTSAILSWQPVSSAVSYNVRWKESSATSYTNLNALTTPNYSLTGLSASSYYEFQVQAVCASGAGAFTPTISFNTMGTNVECDPPSNVSASIVTTSSSLVSWSAVTSASLYILYWKPVSAANYSSQNNLQAPNWQLTGLIPNTQYVVQVQSLCGDPDEFTSSSFLSAPFFFTTASTMQTKKKQPHELKKGTLTLWPNPAYGKAINLRMEDIDTSIFKADIEIFDLVGKRLINQTIAVSNGVIDGSIDLPLAIDKGIYFVMVTVGTEKHTQRLVVECR
jgi:hypothetical protein